MRKQLDWSTTVQCGPAKATQPKQSKAKKKKERNEKKRKEKKNININKYKESKLLKQKNGLEQKLSGKSTATSGKFGVTGVFFFFLCFLRGFDADLVMRTRRSPIGQP